MNHEHLLNEQDLFLDDCGGMKDFYDLPSAEEMQKTLEEMAERQKRFRL